MENIEKNRGRAAGGAPVMPIYKTTSPWTVAMLQCLGAEWVDTDLTDPEHIVFTLTHPEIMRLKNEIHQGNSQLMKQLINLKQHHTKIMDFLKAEKKNRRLS